MPKSSRTLQIAATERFKEINAGPEGRPLCNDSYHGWPHGLPVWSFERCLASRIKRRPSCRCLREKVLKCRRKNELFTLLQSFELSQKCIRDRCQFGYHSSFLLGIILPNRAKDRGTGGDGRAKFPSNIRGCCKVRSRIQHKFRFWYRALCWLMDGGLAHHP